MIDTSVMISALLWPESKPAQAVLHAAKYHDLILCNHIIDEMHDVISRKAKESLNSLTEFLHELQFDLVSYTPSEKILINDPKDQPILCAAIQAHVDIIISSDKHFLQLNLISLRTMNSAQYLVNIAGRATDQ